MRWRVLGCAAVFASLALIATLAVRNGSYYDDEITNLRVVAAHDLTGLWRWANSNDVHPPGAYLINRLLFVWLGGAWPLVKIVGGLLNAAALAGLFWLASAGLTRRTGLVFAGLLASAASFVMWGASVRWYAYFDPLFVTALALILFADTGRGVRVAIFAVSSALLFHLSYAAFCAVPALLAALLMRDAREYRRGDWIGLAAASLIALAACVPQLWVFLHVHYPDQGGQTGSMLQALTQMAITLLIGNALFPVAPLPIAAAVATVGALVWLLVRGPGSSSPAPRLIATLAVGALLLCLSGLGMKGRNALWLLAPMLLLLALSLSALPRKVDGIAMAVIAMAQLVGVCNVILHEDTIKGSYNTDFAGVMRRIEDWRSQCAGRLVVFNRDPVMAWLLEDRGIAQSSVYSATRDRSVRLEAGDCVARVRGNNGVLPPPTLAQLDADLAPALQRRVADVRIGRDRYAEIKSRLAHDRFPDHYLRAELYGVERPVSVPGWYHPGLEGGRVEE